MATTRTTTGEAADKKLGMRLHELEAFLADARLAGATGDELVVVNTTGYVKPRIKTAAVQTTAPATRD